MKFNRKQINLRVQEKILHNITAFDDNTSLDELSRRDTLSAVPKTQQVPTDCQNFVARVYTVNQSFLLLDQKRLSQLRNLNNRV